MNKNILLAIIIFVSLTAGFFYWRSNNSQLTNENPAVQTNDQVVEENVIEIFYLPHPPALAIVEKVEPIIAEFPDFKVIKYNFDDPASKDKVAEYNLVNHYPVAIFIGGKNSFTVDGKTVSLLNFPQGDAFIPSYEGGWTYEDLRKILNSLK